MHDPAKGVFGSWLSSQRLLAKLFSFLWLCLAGGRGAFFTALGPVSLPAPRSHPERGKIIAKLHKDTVCSVSGACPWEACAYRGQRCQFFQTLQVSGSICSRARKMSPYRGESFKGWVSVYTLTAREFRVKWSHCNKWVGSWGVSLSIIFYPVLP